MNTTELLAAGMDVNDFLARLMQNESLVSLFVRKFLEDQNYSMLCRAVEERDMALMESASHTLKGMCGNMSLKTLFILLQKQVMLIRKCDTEGAVAVMQEITPAYEQAAHHMQLWLAAQ